MYFGISIAKLIFVTVAMFFAGFVDSIAGGGGCISLPAYMLTGLPIMNAIASNKASAGVGYIASTFNYLRKGKIDVRVSLISAIAGIIGGNIGGRILLMLDPSFIQKMIVLIIPFVAVFLITKKDFGRENEFETIPEYKVIIISIVGGLLVGIYDAMIGPGSGTLAILLFATLLKFDLKTASGNAKILNLFSLIGSAVLFIKNGLVIWPIAVITGFADIIGSYIGSSLAIKKDTSFIRTIMIIAVAILLIKLGYDAFF